MTSASFEARECQFIGNKAGIEGGAINNRSGRLVRLASCLLSGNAAKEGGGAFATAHGDEVKLVNCTASGNQAPQGRFLRDATAAWDESRIRIANCIIMDGDNEVWNARSTIDIEYSNLSDGHTAIHDPEGQVVWGTGNIDTDPLFADPGYWDPNVTPDDPNDDFWVDGDYHLRSQAGRWDPAAERWVVDEITSPCIDAGDPNSPIGHEPFPNGGIVNMGAYGGTVEASKSWFGEPVCETIIAGDINGDCKVDFADLALLLNHWLESGKKTEE
jgi:hypothetical protein